MKRIEVKLALGVVAPLLDVIKSIGDELKGGLAAPITLAEIEPDLRDPWRGELLGAQNSEVQLLLGLFDSEFFASGTIVFDAANAEPILRACSAVRLRLRERHLAKLDDDALETGEVDINELEDPLRRAFMCYVFLATIQELIIQHLDSSILEG